MDYSSTTLRNRTEFTSSASSFAGSSATGCCAPTGARASWNHRHAVRDNPRGQRRTCIAAFQHTAWSQTKHGPFPSRLGMVECK